MGIPGGNSSPAKCPTKSGGGGGSPVVAEREERTSHQGWTGEEKQLVDSSPGFSERGRLIP